MFLSCPVRLVGVSEVVNEGKTTSQRTDEAVCFATNISEPIYRQAADLTTKVLLNLRKLQDSAPNRSDPLIKFASETLGKGVGLEWLLSYLYQRDRGILLDPSEITETLSSNPKLQSLMHRGPQPPESLADLFGHFHALGISAECAVFIRDKLELAARTSNELGHSNGSITKIIRLVAGVAWFSTEDNSPYAEKREILTNDEILLRGFLYGMSYPFADDIVDTSKFGSHRSRLRDYLYRSLYENRFDLESFDGALDPLNQMVPVVQEIVGRLTIQPGDSFFNSLLILHHSQTLDDQSMQNGAMDERTISHIAVKAAISKMAAADLAGVPFRQSHVDKLLAIGLVNQLQDDLGDLPDDLKSGGSTLMTMVMEGNCPRDLHPLNLLHAGYLTLRDLYQDSTVWESALIRARQRFGVIRKVAGDRYEQICDRLLEDALPGTRKLFEPLMRDATSDDDSEATYTAKISDVVGKHISSQQALFKSQRRAGEIVQSGIEEALKGIDTALLGDVRLIDVVRYALSLPGKNLRATLSLIVSRMFNGNPNDIRPLMNALEYLQIASLIYDDLPQQDNAQYRRGKPTVHVQHGEAGAQLGGITFIGKAFEVLTDLKACFGSERANAVTSFFSHNLQRLCAGQSMDLNIRGQHSLHTRQDVLRIHLGKTGYGIESALVGAAMLYLPPTEQQSEGDKETLRLFSNLGKTMGLLYQVKDDLLESRTSVEIGKDSGGSVEGSVAITTFQSIEKTCEMVLTLERACYRLIDKLPGAESDKNELRALINYLVTRGK